MTFEESKNMSLQEKIEKNLASEDDVDSWIPVDVSFIKEFWLPDAEILNLKVRIDQEVHGIFSLLFVFVA